MYIKAVLGGNLELIIYFGEPIENVEIRFSDAISSEQIYEI